MNTTQDCISQKQHLTENQLIARWGVSKSALFQWRKYRGLPFIKNFTTKGRYQVLFPLEAVEQFEKNNNLRDNEKLLTETELAERWGISKSALCDWRAKHGLPFCKKGFQNVLFRLEDVEQYEKYHNLIDQGEVLTEKQLAARWGVVKQTVGSRRNRNLPFFKKGPRSVLFRLVDVEKYEEEHKIGEVKNNERDTQIDPCR